MLASGTQGSRCLRNLVLLLAASLLVTLASCLQGSTCYNDNGVIIEDDVPCSPNAEQSFCCGKYWTCLDGGFCSDQNTTQLVGTQDTLLARATCTDRTFKSDACPKFCLGDLGRGITLSETNNSFCCQQDLNLPCHADPIVKSLDFSNPLTTISLSTGSIVASTTTTRVKVTTSSSSETSSSAQPTLSSTSRTSKATSSTSSRSRAAVTTSQATKTSGSSTDLAVAASSTAQAPLAIAPTTSPASVPKSTGLSEGAKIGISVSITLVVVSIVAALLFFWFRRRERRKRAGETNTELPAPVPAGGEKGYYAPDYTGMGHVPQELDDSRKPADVLRGELPTESHNPRAEMSDPFGQKLAGSQRRPLELA